MPDDLEQFLRTAYPSTKASIEQINFLIKEVVDVFTWTFDEGEATWPYQLVSAAQSWPATKYSFSTTAMIAFALQLATGRVRDSSLAPAAAREVGPVDLEQANQISALVTPFIQKALHRISQKSVGQGGSKSGGALTKSSTFGDDDPFTLTWLLELLSTDTDPQRKPYRDHLRERGWSLVEKVLSDSDPLLDVLRIDADERVSHAFPLLRVLQLGDMLSRREYRVELSRKKDLSGVRELFLNKVHLHLSESSIPASGFDPADLVLALEGWILSTPIEPDFAVIDRAFHVLREYQSQSSYWRPLRPFKVTQQGLELLPQSVEIANSLLRICGTPSLARRGYFSKHIALFEQYAKWLLGRAFRGFAVRPSLGNSPFVGWESDHTYTLNRIHLWQTSQVLIFLQHYVAMLQRHVAETCLRLAGFRKPLVEKSRPVSESAKPSQRDQGLKTVPSKPENSDKKEAKDVEGNFVWKEEEPFSGGAPDSPYHVYESIEKNFITPRRPGSEATPLFSMLLYGPPGTGKSTIAELLAKAIGFPLLTITPSDFITAGELVEARAKAIFDVLGEQTDLVVLFDEIDHLLLDRDSKFYHQQGDFFKLLTPGMLTKLSELRKKSRTLFIIATNYFERIDKAIKRPGRIDARYLVLPPDKKRRGAILEGMGLGWKEMDSKKKEQVLKATVRFTYTELKDLWRYVEQRGGSLVGDALAGSLVEATSRVRPMTTIETYRARMGEGKQETEWGPGELPSEEFALIAYLELEAKDELPKDKWVKEALRRALNEGTLVDRVVEDRLRKFVEKESAT